MNLSDDWNNLLSARSPFSWAAILAVLLGGMVLSIWVYVGLNRHIRHTNESELERRAERAKADIQAKLNRQREQVFILERFFNASDFVSREEFAQFASDMVTGREEVLHLGWVPVIPHEYRSAAEDVLAEAGGKGLLEVGENGELRAAEDKERYYTVFYCSPECDKIRGLHLESISRRVDMQQEDEQVSDVVISTRAPVADAEQGDHVYEIYTPVSTPHELRTPENETICALSDHYIRLVFDYEKLVASAMENRRDIELSLQSYVNRDGGGKTDLPWRAYEGGESYDQGPDMEYIFEVSLGDTKWVFIATPGPSFVPPRIPWMASAVFWALLLFSFMAAGLLFVMHLRTREASRLAAERAEAIEELEAAREQMAESEQRYEELVDRIPVGVFRLRAVDEREFEIDYVSPRFCDLVGIAHADASGKEKSIFHIPLPEEREEFRGLFIRAVADGEQIRWEGKSLVGGEHRWFRIECTPTRINDSEVVIDGMLNDVTERREMEQTLRDTKNRLERTLNELRETQNKLVNQERFQALSRMASGIAHEFNNALSPIKGYADLLLDDPGKLEDTDVVQEYLERMRDASERASETVRRMGQFYRKHTRQTSQSVDMRAIVEEAVEAKRENLAGDQDIQLVVTGEQTPMVKGDPAELREMIDNLVDNAVEALDGDGGVEVRLRPAGDSVALGVVDTGEGMDDNALIHCTDPFFTTRQPEANGLGLAVVEGIVSRHDGFMQIESERGRGTEVHVVLPARTDQEGETGDDRSLNILVVDDEKMQRKFVADNLENLGYRVVTVPGATKALQYLEKEDYDLILIDYMMPDMNGVELSRRVKDLVPGIAVIIMSGSQAAGGLVSGDEEAVDRVVEKSLQRQAWEEIICSVLNGSEK